MSSFDLDPESLTRLLRAYDASIDVAAVKAAAFGPQGPARDNYRPSWDDSNNPDAGNALLEWVMQHITPDTLLTVDELNQFTALEKAGLVEKLAADADLATVHAFSDQEIKDAIEELNRSTDAISKQTEALKQQREALERLVTGSTRDGEARADLESRQIQKWESERKSVQSSIHDLSQVLESKILELEQDRGDGPSAKQTVDSLLRSDDKLLSSLQKLGMELEKEDPEEQKNVEMLRETCARLIKFTVEGTRTKLDRVYLEALESAMRSGNTGPVDKEELADLQAEVEDLYKEILPVAQMSTQQQFLDPALKDLADRNGQELAKSDQAVAYINECLDYMLDRSSALIARIEAYQAYQAAASSLTDMAKLELATETELPAAKEQPDIMASPVRPQRTRPLHKRRSSAFSGLVDETPLDAILQSLAISLPQDDELPANANVAQAQLRFLAGTLGERKAKVLDVARDVQETFEGATAKQIADAKLATQLVRDSVLAESQFGDVRLMDPEIESSISVLTQEMGNVAAKLQGVDDGLAKARGKSAKRDELIARWG